MNISRDIRPRPRHYSDNYLESTAQSLGSWWAGVRENDEKMDLVNLQWLLGGQDVKVHFTTCGTKKVLQLKESEHPNSLPMAVGRAAYGIMNIRREIVKLESEFSANQAICMDLSNMCDGGEAVSAFVLGRSCE